MGTTFCTAPGVLGCHGNGHHPITSVRGTAGSDALISAEGHRKTQAKNTWPWGWKTKRMAGSSEHGQCGFRFNNCLEAWGDLAHCQSHVGQYCKNCPVFVQLPLQKPTISHSSAAAARVVPIACGAHCRGYRDPAAIPDTLHAATDTPVHYIGCSRGFYTHKAYLTILYISLHNNNALLCFLHFRGFFQALYFCSCW